MTAADSRLVCGLQPVRECIRAHGAKVQLVVVEQTGREASPTLEALARFARDHGVRVERRARADLDRTSGGARHQGAIAFAPELVIASLDDLALGDETLVVVLDEVQDPQNFGAIIRSAVAMGATAVVWPEHSSAPLSPATFRASAGAVEHAVLCRVGSLPTAIADLESRGLRAVGLDMSAETPIDRVDLAGPVGIVVGAEGKGLRKSVKRACSLLARVPMPGAIESLNVSAALGIALYEVGRQRRANGDH